MKEQQISILHDQIKNNQAEFREKTMALEEELEVERENGVQLQKVQD